MPIFRDEEKEGPLVLFIHVPKTGGTSIEHEFKKKKLFRVESEYLYTPWGEFVEKSKKQGIRCSLQHLTFHEIMKIFPNIKIAAVFIIVRDPYDRLISEYYYLKKRLWKKDKDCRLWGLSASWCRNAVSDFNIFVTRMYEKYLAHCHFMDNHFLPQVEFLRGLESHPLASRTKIYPFHQISDGSILSSIREDLTGILSWEKDEDDSCPSVLVHKNRFTPQDASSSTLQMTHTTKLIIETWFHQDFKFFGFPSRLSTDSGSEVGAS